MHSLFPLLLPLLPLISATGSSISSEGWQAPFHNVAPHRMVKDDYRVLFRDGYTLDEHYDHIGQNLSETTESFHYIRGINGYRARLDEETVHEIIRCDPGVEAVEQNNFRERDELPEKGKTIRIPKDERKLEVHKRWTVTEETTLGWWQQMTNVYEKVDLTDIWFEGELYTEAGEGVNIYIMDTGVMIDHDIFEGKASNFKDTAGSPYTRSSWDDETGHGTHVAGIAHRFAPFANIVNVKVTAGDATDSDTIQAIDDIVVEHNINVSFDEDDFHGSIINMSFRESDSKSLRQVIAFAIEHGVPVVTSAGNQGDTQGSTPCGYESVQCVAACTKEYKRWPNSNFGRFTTIVAPGEDIISADWRDDEEYIFMSGTSQASPIVAGILASYIGYEEIQTDVNKVYTRMRENSLQGVLTFPNRLAKTPNMLINTGFNHPKRIKQHHPYYIPRDELKMKFVMDKALAKVTAASNSTNTTLEWGPSTTLTDTSVVITTGSTITSFAEPTINASTPGVTATATGPSTTGTFTAIPRSATLTTLLTKIANW